MISGTKFHKNLAGTSREEVSGVKSLRGRAILIVIKAKKSLLEFLDSKDSVYFDIKNKYSYLFRFIHANLQIIEIAIH